MAVDIHISTLLFHALLSFYCTCTQDLSLFPDALAMLSLITHRLLARGAGWSRQKLTSHYNTHSALRFQRVELSFASRTCVVADMLQCSVECPGCREGLVRCPFISYSKLTFLSLAGISSFPLTSPRLCTTRDFHPARMFILAGSRTYTFRPSLFLSPHPQCLSLGIENPAPTSQFHSVDAYYEIRVVRYCPASLPHLLRIHDTQTRGVYNAGSRVPFHSRLSIFPWPPTSPFRETTQFPTFLPFSNRSTPSVRIHLRLRTLADALNIHAAFHFGVG